MFSCEYCEISKNTYYKEHPRTFASGDTQKTIVKYSNHKIKMQWNTPTPTGLDGSNSQ